MVTGLPTIPKPGASMIRKPAIGFLAFRRDQDVQRHAARHAVGHVVDLAVGDRHDAGEPGARDFADRALDLAEQQRAGVAFFVDGDGAQIQVGELLRLIADRRPGRVGEGGAVVDLHRSGPVDHQQSDIRQRFPRFPHQPGTGQPQQQHGEREDAKHRAFRPPPQRQSADQSGRGGDHGDQPNRQQRVEAKGRDDLFGMHGVSLAWGGGPRPGLSRLLSGSS